MNHLYRPEIPMMTIQATPDELVALGGVITQYIVQYERTPNKTQDTLELIVLLRSFQGRLIAHVQKPPSLLPPGARGRQR